MQRDSHKTVQISHCLCFHNYCCTVAAVSAIVSVVGAIVSVAAVDVAIVSVVVVDGAIVSVVVVDGVVVVGGVGAVVSVVAVVGIGVVVVAVVGVGGVIFVTHGLLKKLLRSIKTQMRPRRKGRDTFPTISKYLNMYADANEAVNEPQRCR